MLRDITPPGAPALRVYSHWMIVGNRACPVPLTRPWLDPVRERAARALQDARARGDIVAQMTATRPEEIGDWLVPALEANISGLPTNEAKRAAVLEHLCNLLAGTSRNRNGVPAFSCQESTATIGNRFTQEISWAINTKKHGADARAILAAVAHDLEGFTAGSVSHMLGLVDHERPAGADDKDAVNSLIALGTRVRIGEASRAMRYVRRGREILASLGAWPWAYFPSAKKRPAGWQADWHKESTYLNPLEIWHRAAIEAAARPTVDGRRGWTQLTAPLEAGHAPRR